MRVLRDAQIGPQSLGAALKSLFAPREAIPPGRESISARLTARGSSADLIRLAAIAFVAPNAIVAASFGAAPAAVVLFGCFLALAAVWRNAPEAPGGLLLERIHAPTLAGCATLGFALCILGGEGHFLYPNADWLIRDGVLSDIVSNGFKVVYRYQDKDFLLRAPLGVYAAPAAVGWIWGLRAAHLALLAQNSVILSIILYFVARLARTRVTPFLLLLIAFSGVDIVPVLFIELARLVQGQSFLPFSHIEWWNETLQYSSHVTQLFWAPSHSLPGWWFAVLALLYARREVDLAVLAASFASMLFWSPLSMLGAIPFLIFFGLQLLPRRIFSRRNLIVAAGGLCFLPIALYLTIDAGEVPHRLLLGTEGFLALYVLFLAVEIPQGAIVVAAWDKVEPQDRALVALSLALLIAIPLYEMGVSNDFATRASIPALFLLAFAFARVATLVPRDNGRFATTISVLVILSATTAVLEIKRSFSHAYAISDCNFLTAWRKADPSTWPANYLARVGAVPSWLVSIGGARVTIESRQCWPDHPFLDNKRK